MRAGVAALGACLLAGCVGDAADDRSGPLVPSVLYLSEDLTLRPDAPPEGAVAVGSFYRAWAQGDEQPTWRGEPAGGSSLVTAARLAFSYTSDGIVTTTGPADQGFPEFVVYFGTDPAPMAWASVETDEAVAVGQTSDVVAELELPVGGLVLPAGVVPVVKIAPVQSQTDDGSRVLILVGGDASASRIELTQRPTALPETLTVPVLDVTGSLVGSAYALGTTEGASSRSYPVEVPDDALGLVARMHRTGGVGVQDVDLEVLGPEGDVVARSVTPEPGEGVALYDPNIAAVGTGTWTARVVNYGSVVADFELSVDLLMPP